jgi:hypothetical protein
VSTAELWAKYVALPATETTLPSFVRERIASAINHARWAFSIGMDTEDVRRNLFSRRYYAHAFLEADRDGPAGTTCVADFKALTGP